MKKVLFSALLLLSTACSSKEPTIVSGVFTEAELNTVTIAPEQGAAVTFSTEGAELIGFEGLLPGAPVEVTYVGRLQKEGATSALRIEVEPLYARLMGRWIETGDGADQYGMGFELLPADPESRDKKSRSIPIAQSIGMNTLVFRQWRLMPNGKLWFSGHSLGNGSSITFAEEWRIELIDEENLIISQPDLRLHLRRETEEDILRREEREAASIADHAPKSRKKKK